MTGRKTEPRTRDTAILPSPPADDPRLGYEIRHLELTARGLRACRRLGVRTIQDFLRRDRADFTRLRNCGDRTYDDLAQRVREFLSGRQKVECDSGDAQLERPLRSLIDNPRAERAFAALGITTVGEFLDTQKSELLAVKGFGERTYWMVAQRIRQALEAETLALLPQALLEFEIRGLRMRSDLTEALEQAGITRVGTLLEASMEALRDTPAIGASGIEATRAALERMFLVGIDHYRQIAAHADDLDFENTMSEVLALLGNEERTVFTQRVGLGGGPRTLRSIATGLGIELSAARVLEEQIRAVLRTQAPTLLQRIQSEAHREFRAHDGVILRERLIEGTFLYEAGRHSDDGLLPLRLVRFLLAGEFHLYGDVLSTLGPRKFRKLRNEVRRSCARRQLPLAVTDLAARVRCIVDPPPTGLLMHLVRSNSDLRVRMDPVLGDVIQPAVLSLGDRIHAILVELGRPGTLEDILFIHRDLHGKANMQQILDHLRMDPRFIEVGRATWNLRSVHKADLEQAEPEAEAIIAEMLEARAHRNMLDLRSNPAIPERRVYMIIECMRQDPRVRYMGRGLFCVPGEKSTVMEDIRESMRRAMGEIVISRFVDNQPRQRRRLAECLLRENRALVETAPDRIDGLSNYPFNEERLRRLFDLLTATLLEGRGFAVAGDLLATVQGTDLGGGWLTTHMLLDLLRRHTRFELLPGGIVALPDLGLGGWVQKRIRECLRARGGPMGAEQILADAPDLAAFADAVRTLAEQDPMVQSIDGQFAVV